MKLLKYLPLLCILNATASFAQDAPVKDSAAATTPKVIPTHYVREMSSYLPPVASAIGLTPYYDYTEAAAASIKLKKPVLLYFTGITNNNSRMMEKRVWANPVVAKMLREDFIVAFLYCDENKFELPIRQQYYSKVTHKQVIHLGEKNADLQGTKYGTNGQPMLYFVDGNMTKVLPEPYTYNQDIQRFVDYLNLAKDKYASTH